MIKCGWNVHFRLIDDYLFTALVFILLICVLQSKELTAYQSHQEKKGTIIILFIMFDLLWKLIYYGVFNLL